MQIIVNEGIFSNVMNVNEEQLKAWSIGRTKNINKLMLQQLTTTRNFCLVLFTLEICQEY